MTLVAGIDSSTQSCKVLVVEAETGRIVREGRAAHPESTEVDPEVWWAALRQAIRSAGGIDDVVAASIAGQQHGMVALDANGEVVRPAMLWNNTRSAEAAEHLRAELGDGELLKRTGLIPVASFTISKLRWLRDNGPDEAQRVAAVALPHDWLLWRLRGFGPGAPRGADLDELVTDRSEASGTGYWGPDGYDRELLVHALGRDVILPRVLRQSEWATDREGRRFGPGMGDNASAAFALDAGPGDGIVSIGTSGTVSAVTEHRVLDASGTIACFADGTDRYLPLVATMNAGRALESVAKVLAVDSEGFSDLALAAMPGAEGLRLEPYFEGERTPNLPDHTGEISGMTLRSFTRENLALAAVEGVFRGLVMGFEKLDAHGVAISRLFCIGGGFRSAAVVDVARRSFPAQVVVPTPLEYAALGAARQAALVADVPWSTPGLRAQELG